MRLLILSFLAFSASISYSMVNDDVVGCTDPNACNYDPLATVDDGSCIVLGCTNPSADNYSPTANENNGSCTYGGGLCTGLTYEVIASDPLGTGESTYHIYATFSSPEVEVTAMYGLDTEVWSLVGDAPFYQDDLGSDFAGQINPLLFPSSPSIGYDTWWTIGAQPGDDDGLNLIFDDELTSFEDWNSGGDFVVNTFYGGTIFIWPGSNEQGVPVDGRVLLGQVTTAGTTEALINLQFRDNNEESFFASGMTLTFPSDSTNSNGCNDCTDSSNGNGTGNGDAVDGSAYCGWGTYWNEDSMACVLLVPPYLGDYGDFSALNPCYFNLDNSSSVGANDLLNFLGVYGQEADCLGYDDAGSTPWSCGDPVGYQGYDYATVLIGDQCWFAENLRNQNYDNGDAILDSLSASEWSSTLSGATAVFGEGDSGCSGISPFDVCDEDWSLNEYGRLYNWYAVDDPRGLCPSGWHVPTDGEWITMEMGLGMTEAEANGTGLRGTDQGLKMKAEDGWIVSINSFGDITTGNGTNSSGFSALSGGARNSNYSSNTGSFYFAGGVGNWWTSSPASNRAWDRVLCGCTEGVYRYDQDRRFGFSVRCIQDAE